MAAANTTSYPARNVQIPGSELTQDNTALFGIVGKLHNLAAAHNLSLAAIASGSSTTPTLTAAQFVQGIWDLSGSPGGAWTLTTPTAAQIIAGLPGTIPQDGTFNFFVFCQNDGTGQTATVTAGTGVTVTGTATVASNTTRLYFVNVNVGATTVQMINLGSMSL